MNGPGGLIALLCVFWISVQPSFSAEATHRLGVRNFTEEGIDVRIERFDGREERFSVVRQGCAERALLFEDECNYEICAWGFTRDGFYGCARIETCADAGISFFNDRGPAVDDDSECDYDFDDDDFDTHVVVWCFIGASRGPDFDP